MNSHPAYIPVPTRNSYMSQNGLPPPPSYIPQPLPIHHVAGPSPTPSAIITAPAATSQQSKRIQWSPAVRAYVSRCFAPENQIQGITKQETESKLKQVITDAAQKDQLDTLNWDNMLLPQQMILEERSRAILSPQSHSSSFVSQVPLSMTHTSQHQPLETIRKRKSSELQVDTSHTAQHPWRSGKQAGSLEDRVTFAPTPEKRPKLDLSKPVSKSNANLEQRKRRFENSRDGSSSPRKIVNHHGTTPYEKPEGPVIGRSQKLEKNYFRLTSAPNPDDVRPLEILRKTLEHLKTKWRTESNYVYICDQFKSLRQDLTVQHIKNDFTTNVYEIHARIALEKGDLGEYNQCQTQLRALYKQGLGGHPSEFMAYRILYLIHTCNRTDMNDVLSDLTPADKSEPAVQHALNVRSALALGNYHKFFKLYLTVPNMGGYLMDMFIERERFSAMARICKA